MLEAKYQIRYCIKGQKSRAEVWIYLCRHGASNVLVARLTNAVTSVLFPTLTSVQRRVKFRLRYYRLSGQVRLGEVRSGYVTLG
jgi:hypothetical protein